MLLHHDGPFPAGYAPIVGRRGKNADILMDFGVLTLGPGETWSSGAADEKALLLMSGEAAFLWKGGSFLASRQSLLDEAPTVLSLAEGDDARIEAGPGGAMLAVTRTDNPRRFAPRLVRPEDGRSEERGKGTMREASTRIVRTSFDDGDAPESNLVLGEVVAAPGKWSSYPPHHHPQPELYFYKFGPERGFGLTRIGDEAFVLRDGDTVLIREGQVHPQVTAPGYAMWYLWVIRHLEGNRYRSPRFVDEHRWVQEAGADIWALPSERGTQGEKR
jgi:5-deoxy-glucuronate isomerase